MPTLVLTILLVAVYVIAWLLQSHMLVHQDVMSFTEWAARLLKGGTYTNDFFETNPPLVILLSIPPVLVAKYFSLNIELVIRGYVVLLASFSLWICYSLTKLIFPRKDTVLAYGFLILLAILFLIMPIPSFGQRENLLFIFSMPYCLALTARIEEKPISRWVAVTVGLMAAVGFCFKPFFLITPLLLELYLSYRRRRLKSILRVESLVMFTCIVTYALSVVVFFPDYFSMVMPYMLRYYYQGLASPILLMLVSPVVLICWVTIPYFIMQIQKTNYRNLTTILAILMISQLIAYLSGRTAWYYHTLPTYCASILLFMFFLMEKMNSTEVAGQDFVNDRIIVVELFIILLIMTSIYWGGLYFQSMIVLTALFLLIFSGIYLFQRRRDHARLGQLSAALVGVSFLMLPALMSLGLYREAISLKKSMTPIATFLSQHARHEAVYFLNTTGSHVRPMATVAEVTSTSRFPFLWMMIGMLHQENAQLSQAERRTLAIDKQRLAEMIYEDITINKPKLILVDVSESKLGIEQYKLDYFKYFSDSKHFQKIWKNYFYLTSLHVYNDIDERNSTHFDVTYRVYQRRS